MIKNPAVTADSFEWGSFNFVFCSIPADRKSTHRSKKTPFQFRSSGKRLMSFGGFLIPAVFAFSSRNRNGGIASLGPKFKFLGDWAFFGAFLDFGRFANPKKKTGAKMV